MKIPEILRLKLLSCDSAIRASVKLMKFSTCLVNSFLALAKNMEPLTDTRVGYAVIRFTSTGLLNFSRLTGKIFHALVLVKGSLVDELRVQREARRE